MNVGLVARADYTGLGNQTFQFYRHMHPVKTLVVDISHLNRQTNDFSRYPGAPVLRYTPYPNVRSDPHSETKLAIDEFLKDLDVVFTCETVYDYYLITAAKKRGVKVVLQYNFELLDHIADRALPVPDLFVAPSLWRFRDVPQRNKIFLPVPVDRKALPPTRRESVRSYLHVGGIPALCDRNGTSALIKAWADVENKAPLTITAQMGHYRVMDRRIGVRKGLIQDYESLYATGDVLVLPRKFGGLCLPLNEAMSAAMPIIMTDLAPQNQFLHPESLVPAAFSHEEMTKTAIQIYEPDQTALAAKVDQLYGSPALVKELSDWSDHVAAKISWDRMAPMYEEMLADAVAGKTVQRFSWF